MRVWPSFWCPFTTSYSFLHCDYMKSSGRGESPLSLALSCCVSVRRLERSPVTPERCHTDFPEPHSGQRSAQRTTILFSPARRLVRVTSDQPLASTAVLSGFVSHPLGVVLRRVLIAFKPLWRLMRTNIRRFVGGINDGNVGLLLSLFAPETVRRGGKRL